MYVFIALILALAAVLGIGLGLALSGTANTIRTENFTEFDTALPTKIYDINGRLITEFFAEEQRIPISIKELPDHLIEAFITREDQSFYSHHGFSLRSIMRAATGQILGTGAGKS